MAAGYAAGLRASGSTFISDDEVDPAVVLVRMLPTEFVEEAVARAAISKITQRFETLVATLDPLFDRLAELERRIERIEGRRPSIVSRNDSAAPARRPALTIVRA